MRKKIGGFENIIVIKKENYYSNFPNITEEEKNNFEKIFLSKGWYDGDILACTNYTLNNKKLSFDCLKVKFFDALLHGLIEEEKPKLMSVNAVLNVEDSIILIKRPDDVYDCPDCWDFPAGLIPFNVSLKQRILNRIKNDLGIEEDLILEEEPFSAFIMDHSFNLFFNGKINKSKKELEEFFKKNISKNTPILLKREDISKFIKENKTVFPEILATLSK